MMREYGFLHDSDAAREVAETFSQRVSSFDDYCGLENLENLQVIVREEGEMPDLSRAGLHLVDGDLNAPQASLRDRGEEQCVLVAGDVRCKELLTSGCVFISGHLEAQLLRGESGSNKLLAARSAKLGVLLELGHSIMTEEGLSFDVIYSAHGLVTSEGEETEYPEQLPDEVFVDELIVDEDVDWEKFDR